MIWISGVFLLTVILTGCFLAPAIWTGWRNACQALKRSPIREYYARIQARPSYCPLEDIGVNVRMAVIASEDPEFFWHRGFLWRQIFLAFLTNVRKKRIVSGASTITQQLAKNLYLTPERTCRRKLSEFFITRKLEALLSKEEILELYLNIIYYGAGSYGIREACRHYFHTEPAHISPNQALTIAALLPAPDRYNPLEHPEPFSRQKSRTLLNLMYEKLIQPADSYRFQSAAFDDSMEHPVSQKYNALWHSCYEKRAAGDSREWKHKTLTLFGRDFLIRRELYTAARRIGHLLRKLYHRGKALGLRNRKPTILANNCIGTFIYHDMGLPFYSPTINLTIPHEDFMRFLRDLPDYLASDVYEVPDSTAFYPVGVLRNGEETVRLNFVHYRTLAEARETWNRRKQRVDLHNLYILEFLETADEKLTEEFAALPYANKLLVTSHDPAGRSCVAVMAFLNSKAYHTGQLLEYKPHSLKRYLDDLDYIRFLNHRN